MVRVFFWGEGVGGSEVDPATMQTISSALNCKPSLYSIVDALYRADEEFDDTECTSPETGPVHPTWVPEESRFGWITIFFCEKFKRYVFDYFYFTHGHQKKMYRICQFENIDNATANLLRTHLMGVMQVKRTGSRTLEQIEGSLIQSIREKFPELAIRLRNSIHTWTDEEMKLLRHHTEHTNEKTFVRAYEERFPGKRARRRLLEKFRAEQKPAIDAMVSGESSQIPKVARKEDSEETHPSGASLFEQPVALLPLPRDTPPPSPAPSSPTRTAPPTPIGQSEEEPPSAEAEAFANDVLA